MDEKIERETRPDYTFMVNENDLRDWQAGKHIQHAMPYSTRTILKREIGK